MNQMTIAASILSIGLIAGAFIATNDMTAEDGSKTFNIVMENNRYSPAEIVAAVGDRVIINFENRDSVAHAVALPEFNATIPGGHVQPNKTARMEFVASRALSTDAAVCGGAAASDTTDAHGETLVVKII